MNQLLIVSLLVAGSVFMVGIAGLMFMNDRRRRQVQRRLEDYVEVEGSEEFGTQSSILRDTALSSNPALDNLLRNVPAARSLQAMLLQADVGMRVGTFSMLTLGVAALGGFLAASISGLLWAAIPGGLLLGLIPLVVIHRKKENRRMTFEKQFPDALDLMVGALRSGMALPGAIQVVSEESPDPVATEFRIVFEEQRLGLTLREAFMGMIERVDSTELRLFVTAVLIQRETGGNLAEILEGTAAVIRDRFRILGDVKTITAQARFSGGVLTVLPLVMAVFLIITAPDYMKIMITDPIGPWLIASAVFLQLAGFLWIRKIINIKV